MEEQIATGMNQAIDYVQVLLVPLAAAGVAAWISPFVNDKSGGVVAQILKTGLNKLGGNVGKATNDENKQ